MDEVDLGMTPSSPAREKLTLLGTDILGVAERFRRCGALRQAEELYREVARQEPENAEVWSRLGEVYRNMKRPREAQCSYCKALELQPQLGHVHNNLGVALLELHQPDEAAASFHEAVRLQPDFAEAHNNLGSARMERGQLDEAEACFREALRLKPAYGTAQCNLGQVLFRQGRLQEAVACFGQAVEAQPDFARAWFFFGGVLRALGRSDDAAASFERALKVRPGDIGALNELGALRLGQGRLVEAIACYERALRIQPDSATAHNNLGLALLGQGSLKDAVLSFRQALYLRPDLAEIHNNLGMGLRNQGIVDEAVRHFQAALRLQPDLADAHNNLGLALAVKGSPDEAMRCYERALQVEPKHFGAFTNLGNAYKDQGRLTEAVTCYGNALALRPDEAKIHSNLLLALHYQPDADPQEILCEARRYAQQHAAPLAGAIKPFQARPLVGGRLRIGYVSADFREHAVAYFLEPILSAHDHQRFEIFCYADVPAADAVTQRLQVYADHWRSLVGMPDAQVADAIREDGIDILVDLAGHTRGNRLLVFARKPAPVQASYLGYLGTTGLPTIDYYITDAHTDPPGLTEAHFQEQLVRLPEYGFCYQPGPAPDVSPSLPAYQAGQVTFGCLNPVVKLSAEVLALWARVLKAVPISRIVLRTGVGWRAEERIRDSLAGNGVSQDRLLLADQTVTRLDYLKLFQAVDLCLDPFPYAGVTTTCDALWMGVPVLTLAGRTSVSRMGVRFVGSVGLTELIVKTPEAYVRMATALADDLPRLAALRCGLRERMSRSPLMNACRFTQHLEDAYRGMWDRWLTSPQ